MAKLSKETTQPVDESTALAEVKKAALATMNNMFVADIESNATGFEDADSNAYAIPFMQILQSGSPQCKRSEGEYIAGAREGMFYNTVTQELFEGEDVVDEKTGEITKGGIVVIPSHYTQRFIEWQIRESGGGFVAEHKPTDPLIMTTNKDDRNRDILPNGHALVDTRNHFVLHVKPNGEFTPVVISMSSTQLKKSRTWMSKMQNLKMKVGNKVAAAPMASHAYRMTTVPEKNEKGTWMGWKIELLEQVSDPNLYDAAQKFRAAVVKGQARMQTPPADAGADISSEEKF